MRANKELFDTIQTKELSDALFLVIGYSEKNSVKASALSPMLLDLKIICEMLVAKDTSPEDQKVIAGKAKLDVCKEVANRLLASIQWERSPLDAVAIHTTANDAYNLINNLAPTAKSVGSRNSVAPQREFFSLFQAAKKPVADDAQENKLRAFLLLRDGIADKATFFAKNLPKMLATNYGNSKEFNLSAENIKKLYDESKPFWARSLSGDQPLNTLITKHFERLYEIEIARHNGEIDKVSKLEIALKDTTTYKTLEKLGILSDVKLDLEPTSMTQEERTKTLGR